MRRVWMLGTIAAAAAIASVLMVLARGEPSTPPGVFPPEQTAPERRVRVEVLNAAGVSGLARAATNRLRDQGFDVVYYGNARSHDPDTSYVYDRVGEPALARTVAQSLGIARVASRPDPDLYLEVTVVLGRDWPANPADNEAGNDADNEAGPPGGD